MYLYDRYSAIHQHYIDNHDHMDKQLYPANNHKHELKLFRKIGNGMQSKPSVIYGLFHSMDDVISGFIEAS